MNTQRIQRRPVHGVLLLDKALGQSSNDALQQAKRFYRAEKAGHTGTLDPLASGLLPICFGAATKFAQASLDADKCYRATLALGFTTRTGDAEGAVLRERPLPSQLDQAAIGAVCARFVGSTLQVPPMHSALKRDGRPLYEYARAGQELARAPRPVTLHRIEIVERQAATLVIDVLCSKGTYIRTLAEDIGEALGCGAHLAALRRIASGRFGIDSALTLDALAAMSEDERDARLLPADALLGEQPEIHLDEEHAARFLTGLRRRIDAVDAPAVRVYGPQPCAFLGSAHIAGGELIADRLLTPTEVMALIAAASPAPRPARIEAEATNAALARMTP